MSETKSRIGADIWYEHATDCSRMSARSFAIYLIAAVYISVSSIGVTDKDIVSNAGATLPIIGISVGLKAFFVLAPLFLVLLYLHFMVYFQRLIECRTKLHTFDELETSELNVRLPAWFITWGISAYDRSKWTAHSFIVQLLAELAVWLSLPLTLNLISFQIVRLHDPLVSYWTAAVAIAGTFVPMSYWMIRELRGANEVSPKQVRSFREHLAEFLTLTKNAISESALVWLFLVFILMFSIYQIAFIIPSALSGWPESGTLLYTRLYNENIARWTTLSLRNECLTQEPLKDYRGVMWEDYRGRHFEGATFIGCVFEGADLTRAQFDNARLDYCYFTKSDANDADFSGASLLGVRFQYADLQAAVFDKADIKKAVFAGANIDRVDLSRVRAYGENYFTYLGSWTDAKLPLGIDVSQIGNHIVPNAEEVYLKIGMKDSTVSLASE